jgi:hypothetical protein
MDPPLIELYRVKRESSGSCPMGEIEYTCDHKPLTGTDYSFAEKSPIVQPACSGTELIPKPGITRQQACLSLLHDHSFTPIQTGNDRLESRVAPPPLYVDRIIETDSTVHANTLQNEEYYRYLNTPPYADTTLQSIKTPRKRK